MPHFRLRLQMPDPRSADFNTVLHATVFDTSEADSRHVAVARMCLQPVRPAQHEVLFSVPDDALNHDRRYSLFVHVSNSASREIETGDLITTDDILLGVVNVQAEVVVEVPLSRI